MSDELLRLADRCEAASGPDRELDAAIVTTLCPGATVAEYIRGEGDDIVFHAQALGIRDKDCCPWYTASLDAAITLVPEGDDYSVHREGTMGVACVYEGGTTVSRSGDVGAATPALALTVACLRARASRLRKEVE